MAEVYWIRLPEHTDVFTQGYVGVTKNTAKSRFCGHLQEATTKRRSQTSRLHNYIRKHGRQGLIFETLVISDLEYAFELEKKLRPTERIGWNVAIGGLNVVNPGGYKLSPETRKKMSESFVNGKRSPVTEETRRKISLTQKGSKRSPLSKESVDKRERTRFLNMWESEPSVWARCGVWYEFYINGMGLARICEKAHNERIGSLRAVFSRFKMGWVPHEDPDWINKFKEIPEWDTR